ncbi:MULTISPECIES: hypothetical protein [Spirulina sp. CCY15215]|uniref:hypothetical protein n=1 Tax=Spirulina sp. CCY15215 TaxID=2767591 RepID=UPI00194F59F2
MLNLLKHFIKVGFYKIGLEVKLRSSNQSRIILETLETVNKGENHKAQNITTNLESKRLGQTETSASNYRTAIQGRDTILFFSPEGSITPHFAAQCVLGKTLQEMGYSVLFTLCTGIFERCPVIDMKRLPYSLPPNQKREVCQTCTQSSIKMLDDYGLPSIDLRAFITPDILKYLEDALENPPRDLKLFKFDGIEFGKLCTIELALIAKKHRFDEGIEEDVHQGWLEYIASSLMSYLLLDKICQTLPISRLVYYSDYSLMVSARLAAEKHGLKSFKMPHASHASVDRRRYTIVPTVVWEEIQKQRQVWPTWKQLHLTREQVQEVADDSIARLGAKSVFVYSPSKTFGNANIYDRLRLSRDKKLIVAYTSSIDEVISMQMAAQAMGIPLDSSPQPFTTQIEWLESLIEYVEKSASLQLVIRIHPRIGSNKRDKKVSEFLTQLREKFDRPFQNSRLIWPEDAISSYDLGEIANLVLIAWSSIGLEFARLGVPVLAFSNGVEYFPDCIQQSTTVDKYFQKLEEMLRDSSGNLEQIRESFLWYNLRTLSLSLNLEDIIPHQNFSKLPEFKMPSEAKAIAELIVGEKHIIDLNLERLKNMQHSEILWEEKIALQRQLRRILHFLFTGEDNLVDYKLRLIESDESWEDIQEKLVQRIDLSPTVRFVFINREEVCYWFNKHSYSKHSPLCARLARVCSHLNLS